MPKPRILFRPPLRTLHRSVQMAHPVPVTDENHPVGSHLAKPAGYPKKAVRQAIVPRGTPLEVHPPRFADQAKVYGGTTGIFATPNIKDVYFFNPSIIDYLGQRRVFFRRSYFDYGPWQNYRTTISQFQLLPNMSLGEEFRVAYPRRHDLEQTDDPRVQLIGGKLTMSVCAWKTPEDNLYVINGKFATMPKHWRPPPGTMATIVHQALAEFDGLSIHRILDVPFRGNGDSIFKGTGLEKNWLWFDHNGQKHFVYSAEPHVVVRVEGDQVAKVWESSSSLRWGYGTVRGGTPPVLIDDLYWTFFHSSLPWKVMKPYGMRNRYFMGALAFDAKPPFNIRLITPKPLLIGTYNEPYIRMSPSVVFPSGAVNDWGLWTIVYGINDCKAGWLKMSHKELKKLVKSCT